MTARHEPPMRTKEGLCPDHCPTAQVQAFQGEVLFKRLEYSMQDAEGLGMTRNLHSAMSSGNLLHAKGEGAALGPDWPDCIAHQQDHTQRLASQVKKSKPT